MCTFVSLEGRRGGGYWIMIKYNQENFLGSWFFYREDMRQEDQERRFVRGVFGDMINNKRFRQ